MQTVNFVKNALLILKNNCVPGQILALSRPEIDKFPAMKPWRGSCLLFIDEYDFTQSVIHNPSQNTAAEIGGGVVDGQFALYI